MTSHRCKDGEWREGKTRHCEICRPKVVQSAYRSGDYIRVSHTPRRKPSQNS